MSETTEVELKGNEVSKDTKKKRLLDVREKFLKLEMIQAETEAFSDNNLASWRVTSVTSTKILIDLEFIDPIKVSQSLA